MGKRAEPAGVTHDMMGTAAQLQLQLCLPASPLPPTSAAPSLPPWLVGSWRSLPQAGRALCATSGSCRQGWHRQSQLRLRLQHARGIAALAARSINVCAGARLSAACQPAHLRIAIAHTAALPQLPATDWAQGQFAMQQAGTHSRGSLGWDSCAPGQQPGPAARGSAARGHGWWCWPHPPHTLQQQQQRQQERRRGMMHSKGSVEVCWVHVLQGGRQYRQYTVGRWHQQCMQLSVVRGGPAGWAGGQEARGWEQLLGWGWAEAHCATARAQGAHLTMCYHVLHYSLFMVNH